MARDHMMVYDLRKSMEDTRWLHDGDAVYINVYDPATGDNTRYALTSIEHDPRDPGVGIPTGALYLSAEVGDKVDE